MTNKQFKAYKVALSKFTFLKVTDLTIKIFKNSIWITVPRLEREWCLWFNGNDYEILKVNKLVTIKQSPRIKEVLI